MSVTRFHDGRVILHAGDCRAARAGMTEGSVDAIVTDPPYHLNSIVRRFGAEGAAPALSAAQRRFAASGGGDRAPGTDQFGRLSRGFMGQTWDGGDVAFDPATWAAALRVLKPGGHLVAFAAPKNAHRMICAIEDAGFEIRDCLMWLFGSGFPKSRNVGGGFGTALKPAYEPICLARKPLSEASVDANVRRWGMGALNIDAGRIEGENPSIARREAAAVSGKIGRQGDGRPHELGRFRANSDRAAALAAYLAPNAGEALGRWPANVCHDGSEEVVEGFPFDDEVSAARFFYSAKADDDDRLGSKHPTVKPVALMQWLVRLVTPPGGVILDPFGGTGTAAEAALREGFSAVLCEAEPQHCDDIARRMAHAFDGPALRAAAAARARAPETPDHGPLFGGDGASRGGRLVYGRFNADGQSGRSDLSDDD